MLYYKLSNGELIEIRKSDEFKNTVDIVLFNGSMTLTYNNNNILLNDIINEVEKDYDKLKIEDRCFQMYSNYD